MELPYCSSRVEIIIITYDFQNVCSWRKDEGNFKFCAEFIGFVLVSLCHSHSQELMKVIDKSYHVKTIDCRMKQEKSVLALFVTSTSIFLIQAVDLTCLFRIKVQSKFVLFIYLAYFFAFKNRIFKAITWLPANPC